MIIDMTITNVCDSDNTETLRKLLCDDSVISVKMYSTSFFSFFSNYLQKNILPTLKYILNGSMFGKI